MVVASEFVRMMGKNRKVSQLAGKRALRVFRAYPLNVLPSGFRFLDGDYPADPLIAREWRNILPFCPRHVPAVARI
jgi:hypothetical protein